ncbi:MAG: hypothetical protein ACRYGF_07330 [Janthinobacterium lividum]
MGLDTVEILLRTEEVFGICLPDEECEKIVTVGDLYRAVLHKLDLPYVPSSQSETDTVGVARYTPVIGRLLHKTIESPIDPDPATAPWTAGDVWLTLQAIIMDQLQAEASEVREEATFLQDLGCQ